MSLEFQFKKAFLEQEAERYIEYLCEPRTREEVYAAIEKIALLHPIQLFYLELQLGMR